MEYRIIQVSPADSVCGHSYRVQWRIKLLWPFGLFTSGMQERISTTEIWDDPLGYYATKQKAVEAAEASLLRGTFKVV